MTNKLQADNVSKTYWSLLCRLGLPSVPPRRGLASQAARGARGRVHQPLDRSASSAGHQLGCLMRGNGIFPQPPWGPGLPSKEGPGVSALHQAGDQQGPSPSELSCPCLSAATVLWHRLSVRGETKQRYDLDRRALTVNSDAYTSGGGGTKTDEDKHFPHGVSSLGNLQLREDCERLGQNSAHWTHCPDLLCDLGKPTNLSELLVLIYKIGITVK